MIFETLSESAERGELMLVDGGMCHWHLRRDGQLTIREIIVLLECRRQGVGTAMLVRLMETPGASSLFAKCPAELKANSWYARMGFVCEGTETTRNGRELNLWRLRL
ncbi:MAG: GNAT family N-acetyltransferase [Dehalococcoidia bacterium]|jgi:N-acetylglutamate synthase-like GNAT family acetyltransferase